MTQFLPPNLLALFAPREPIQYLPPVDKLPHEKKTTGYTGIASYLDSFEDPEETPPPTHVETRDKRRDRKRREKQEQVAYRLEQDIALWDPSMVHNGTGDPFKTLFVSRINYDTSESKLRREFEVSGPVKKVLLVHNTRTGKPRGYAFIEYEHERDMHSAYKHADGKKLDGRRVLVDVERGRTVKGWLPRRLGGGLGGTRRGGPDVNVKFSGREDDRSRRRERSEREERRSRSRDRDRDRERERERAAEREKRRRSRSPRADRDRDVIEVGRSEGRGDRDRERKRRRERSRSRSRDRDRPRRHRSRSRERRDRRDRERRERRERANGEDEFDPARVRVKEEPVDDYPEYPPPTAGDANAALKDEDKKPKHLREQAERDNGHAQDDGEIDY